MRLLGIDCGEKRTGVAIGDTEEGIAIDFTVIETEDSDQVIADIKTLIEKEKIEQVVVGFPMGNNNKKTPQTEKVQRFVEKLRHAIKVSVVCEDERFTTAVYSKIPKKLRQGKSLDALAAMSILQGYIDKMKNSSLNS